MRSILALVALTSSLAVVGQQSIMYVKNDKNPGTSFLMGLIVPGAGQLYNDHLELGFGVLTVSAGLVAGGGAVSNAKGYRNSDSVGRNMQIIGGTIWFAGAVYAAFQSRAINRKNGVEKQPTKDPTSRLRVEPARDGLGIALAF
ncbi:MAG TPA: hypothetical protein PLR96_10935 [Flavobacteriales bacterium]|nr:hypothetical protein [Flavobacteriales bacterium]